MTVVAAGDVWEAVHPVFIAIITMMGTSAVQTAVITPVMMADTTAVQTAVVKATTADTAVVQTLVVALAGTSTVAASISKVSCRRALSMSQWPCPLFGCPRCGEGRENFVQLRGWLAPPMKG